MISTEIEYALIKVWTLPLRVLLLFLLFYKIIFESHYTSFEKRRNTSIEHVCLPIELLQVRRETTQVCLFGGSLLPLNVTQGLLMLLRGKAAGQQHLAPLCPLL